MYRPDKPYKKRVLTLIERTWRTPYLQVRRGLYPTFHKKFSYAEVQHTDGIGTKGIYHWKRRTFRNAVRDALAMNLNDLVLVGGVPYAIQNHIVLPKDDHQALVHIIEELVRECRKRKIAMTGGETSIHSDAQGLDISITVSGFIKIPRVNRCRIGDVLIGLRSSGLHSNGFTKVREIFGRNYRREFVQPTKSYWETVSPLLRHFPIHGMMHITGGAFTKLRDILGNADVHLFHPNTMRPQRIFRELHEKGVSSKDMYSIFNCGIGFVLSVPRREAARLISTTPAAAIVGDVVRGNGTIHFQSAFDGREVRL